MYVCLSVDGDSQHLGVCVSALHGVSQSDTGHSSYSRYIGPAWNYCMLVLP